MRVPSVEAHGPLRKNSAAAESTGSGVTPTHAVLALLGFPVVTGTERMREPLATWLLALGLVAVYAGQFAFGSLDETLPLLGYRAHDGVAIQLFTAVIAHAGWLHLLGNVYFLVAFGDGVEQYLPRWLLLSAFFVLGAVTLAIDAATSDSEALFVGASGGVAVFMGACAVLQPRATVVTRIVIFVVPIRIVWYIAMEVAFQAFMVWRGVPGVAWVAHLAGLGLGIALGAAARIVWGRAFA